MTAGHLDGVDTGLIRALEDFIPQVMMVNHTPGLNIAIARRGQVIWEAGFGHADMEAAIPMAPDTVMHSGSMGKTYTATAVMQLVEQGVLQLHEPVNTWLKNFQIRNPLGEREITVYDLLTHRSGMLSNTASADYAAPRPLGEHLKDSYENARHDLYHGTVASRWGAKVGSTFNYSNYGIATLGYLVEVANPEGLSFANYVQGHIIDPLGMASTQYPPVQDSAHVRHAIFDRFSKGYAGFGSLNVPTPTVYFADYPAGAVVTIPGEHIRLLLAYMNGGTYGGYGLLRPETVRLMLTPQVDATSFRGNADGHIKVGLVWMMGNLGQPDEWFGHGGAHMYGWHNLFRAYPRLDVAFALSTNRWDVVRYGSEFYKHDGMHIADFIASWIVNEGRTQHPERPRRSWAWKVSYASGLMLMDHLHGVLSIKSRTTDEMIEAMRRGQRQVAADTGGSDLWDADGFESGVRDALTIEMNPEAIKQWILSDRCQVAAEELELINSQLAGVGRFTVPVV